MTRRMPKVDDLLQAELAELIQRQVKHPALQDVMVSITRVETSPDLRSARVFVSVLGPVEDEAEVLEALGHSEPFLHRELVKRLRMRRVPRFRFILDHSIAEGDRMASLMRDVAASEGRRIGEPVPGREEEDRARAEREAGADAEQGV